MRLDFDVDVTNSVYEIDTVTDPPARRNPLGIMAHHVRVAPHAVDERHAAGDYPNQHQGGDGLPRWTAGWPAQASWSGTRSPPTTSPGRRTGR